MFAPYLLIFVVFYFLLIAPARKKQKRHQEMLQKLEETQAMLRQLLADK